MQASDTCTATDVVVTGMGLATGLGRDVETTWEGIRAGKIGLGHMTAMESTLPEGALGGQAMDLPVDFAPGMPRESRYLRWVIEQALQNAAPLGAPYEPARRAIVLGTTLHGIRAGGEFLRHDDAGALKHFLANSITRLAIQGLGIEGLSATTCSACSSSLGAIALGVTMLESGQADMVIAGGYDAVSEYVWAGFNALRLISPASVLPFARHRQGMMVAEGYAVLVLERSQDARRRGAPALVAVKGWGESADAHHLTQPDPSGSGAARAMHQALARARALPTDISMIAAHATATPDNDAAEYAAFYQVFGESLAHTPVVGFKSYLGHTLGGAGAVELVLSACALRTQWVPPCATVQQKDIDFMGLSVAPPGGIQKPIKRTLNTSLGFGGANTCVVLGPGDDDVSIRNGDKMPVQEVWITGCGIILPGISSPLVLLDKLNRSIEMIAPQDAAASVSDAQLAQILNVRRMRRLSMCVKLMLASVSLAIKDGGLEGNRERLALASALLASTHGSPGFCAEYYSQIVREGVLGANPVLFAEGVPNAGAAHLSTTFGINGACQTIIGSRTAGLDALGLAAMRIRTNASQMVVVGAAEETHEYVDRAYRHVELDRNAKDGKFFTTPGSVSFILESSLSAMARGASPLARIGEYSGVSASRGGAESPSVAMKQLQTRGVVLGSGNRTWIDRAEARAARGLPGVELVESLHNRVGDLFSAGPLLGIARFIAEKKHSRATSLCTDFTGTAAAIAIETL